MIEQSLRGGDDPALIAWVRDLVGRFTLTEMYASAVSYCAGDVEEIQRILGQLAGTAPDLAFRLLITLASNFHMVITSEFRAELEAVSQRLAHPDDALDRLQED